MPVPSRIGSRAVAALRFALLCSGLGAGLASCAAPRTDSAVAASPATAALAKRMNVLFIIADDLRTGGAFGSREVRTPNIDAFAARGVRFDQAYTQFPLCAPSRASMLSGLRPNTVRVYDLVTTVRGNAPDVVTMPQYFRQNGYFTARVGKLFHQGVPGGIGKNPDPHDDPASWDIAINPSGRDKTAEREGRIVNLTPKVGYGIAFAHLADGGSDAEQTDGMVATRALELIEANKDKPFFIAAGFYRPHVPEVAPKRYFDLYPQVAFEGETPERKNALPAARGPAYSYVGAEAEKLTLAQQRDFVRAYYASTSFMDAQVGRLLDGLQKSGVADHTIVVFTSDHGFNLGEHGSWQKMTLWDQSTRVPMVIYAPHAKGNGRSSSRLVEMLDLYPTLADMAGLPAPNRVEGRSLRPLLARPQDPWDYPALTQLPGGQSVRFRNWRYSEWGKGGADGIELYDLSRDPGEYHNLAGQTQFAAIALRLKAMLPGDPPPSTAPRRPAE